MILLFSISNRINVFWFWLYRGHGALHFCPKHHAYSRAALIWVNMVMLSTWFASNLLIVQGKKTQAMILNNLSQEPVLHIRDSAIFLKKGIYNLPSKILMIPDTICIKLKIWKKKRNRPAVDHKWINCLRSTADLQGRQSLSSYTNSRKELRRNCSPIGHNNTKHFLCPIRSPHPLEFLEIQGVPKVRSSNFMRYNFWSKLHFYMKFLKYVSHSIEYLCSEVQLPASPLCFFITLYSRCGIKWDKPCIM